VAFLTVAAGRYCRLTAGANLRGRPRRHFSPLLSGAVWPPASATASQSITIGRLPRHPECNQPGAHRARWPAQRAGGLSQGARRASHRTCDADEVREQRSGLPVRRWRRLPKTCVLDKGYDVGPIHEACEDRGCRPIIPLRETLAVRRGDHKRPCCEHGEWRFAGSDAKRGASKWRCPTGDCKPASRWVKADRLHPLLPRRRAGASSTRPRRRRARVRTAQA
jgi:hypothetical protein